jgi:UbiD family decarboxylase
VVLKDDAVDLNQIPLLRVYPGDADRVITLGLMITKDPETNIPNVGVYRLQLQSKNTATVQWLSVRGCSRHLRKAAEMGKKLEVAIAIGVHPWSFSPRLPRCPLICRVAVCGAVCREGPHPGQVQNGGSRGARRI